jgi:hypothetical protein
VVNTKERKKKELLAHPYYVLDFAGISVFQIIAINSIRSIRRGE